MAAATDLYVKVMKCVSSEATPEIIECPAEPDGTLLLKTLAEQFPGAQGIIYYNRESHMMTPMPDKNGVVDPPPAGWQGRTFLVSFHSAIGGAARKRGREESSGSDAPKEACKRLYVGNIPFSIKTSEDLKQHFPGATQISLPVHADTQRIKGYAYVEYTTIEEATKTFEEKNWMEIHGRQIRLDYDSGGPVPKRMNQNDFAGGGHGNGYGRGGGRGYSSYGYGRGRGGY